MDDMNGDELFRMAMDIDWRGPPKVRHEFGKAIFRAAKKGHQVSRLICALGNRACDGCFEVHHDEFKFQLDLLESLSHEGNADAQWLLGRCYFRGLGGANVDEEQAFKWFLTAAETGHAMSQYNVGYCYYHGKGVETDKSEALKWWKLGAKQNYADAQYMVGHSYHLGEGVEVDKTESLTYYLLAAEQGHAMAEYNMGYAFYHGEGVTRDFNEAVMYFLRAAEKDYNLAQDMLGLCYYYGNGVPVDQEEGIKWHLRAAESGYFLAQFALGIHYSRKVDQLDEAKAVDYFRQASDEDPVSLFCLGMVLCNALDLTIRDRFEGCKCFWESALSPINEEMTGTVEWANELSMRDAGATAVPVYDNFMKLYEMSATAYWHEGIRSLQVLSGCALLKQNTDTSELPELVLGVLDDIREVSQLGGCPIPSTETLSKSVQPN